MKKIIILSLLLLFLQSCFGGSDTAQSGLSLQDTGDFSILMPENWAQVDETNIPTPKSGEVVLAYTSMSERQGYLNNIVILKTTSQQGESAQSLMKNSMVSLQNTIDNFSLIEEKTAIFLDEQSSTILTYSGRYNDTTPLTTYIQTARVCGKDNYYLTLSLAEQLESYERYEYILQTFQCN